MKVEVATSDAGRSYHLKLSPETEGDKSWIENFAKTTSRPHVLTCRGFQYLSPEVEFLIQPMPSSD